MDITELKIGDRVRIKLPSPQGERLSIPMQVIGFLVSTIQALKIRYILTLKEMREIYGKKKYKI